MARDRNQRLLPRFLRNHGTHLHADLDTWALGGYALLSASLNRKCAHWLRDWRDREGVQPWMLLNLALALRELGRHDEAHAVSKHALALNINDSLDQHRLLLAIDAGLAGDRSRLAQLLADLGEPEVSAYYQYLHEFALALHVILHPDDRDAAFRKACQHLRTGSSKVPNNASEQFLRHVQNRALWRIALARSGFLPLTLFWFSWLTLALILHLFRHHYAR